MSSRDRNDEGGEACPAVLADAPPAASLPHWIPSRLRTALVMLLESFNYAHDLQMDAWDYSVEFPNLTQLGLSSNDCRWLIARGLVEHAQEITSCHDDRRRFTRGSRLTFTSTTCFVLTEEGLGLARQAAVSPAAAAPGPLVSLQRSALPEMRSEPLRSGVPRWDSQRRELRLGGELVKAFKVPAPNQEIILSTFEEERWPPRIDDPLPVKGHVHPSRRLHDAILSLNRNQRRRLIRFSADGLGKGIRWELVEVPREQFSQQNRLTSRPAE